MDIILDLFADVLAFCGFRIEAKFGTADADAENATPESTESVRLVDWEDKIG